MITVKRGIKELQFEAKEIVYLQTSLCNEVRHKQRVVDAHFMKAFMILTEMYEELMRQIKSKRDQSANQSAKP